MPRSIWSGAISFGLVNVPVKLYSAVSRQTVRFHQLHDADGVRIQQKRVCPADGEEVPYEHIVKGFEVTPGRYVVVEPAELDALAPQKSRTIDIEDFVELSGIDPVYYDHPYYLMPATGAAKPYRLLLEAMREAGRVAIARVVLRQKEHLVAIRPVGEVLGMTTMLFGDEVVPPEAMDEIEAAREAEATDRELAMARQLVESLSTDFDPDRYRDEYRAAVLEMIERKAAGEEVAVQPEAPPPSEVPDLMAALEASLAQARGTKMPWQDGDGGTETPKKPAAKKKGAAAKKKPAAKKSDAGRKKPAAKSKR